MRARHWPKKRNGIEGYLGGRIRTCVLNGGDVVLKEENWFRDSWEGVCANT